MFKKLFQRFLGLHVETNESESIKADDDGKSTLQHDPLDPLTRVRSYWPVEKEKPNPFVRSVKDFPFANISDSVSAKSLSGKKFAMDDAVRSAVKAIAMDDGSGSPSIPVGSGLMQSAYEVPEALQNWYMSQGFIGYQACALIDSDSLVST
jgi:hypothetical protein